MHTYVVLLRGVNVGGKNKVPMTQLKDCLESLGFSNVRTYIASGNVILQSDKPSSDIKSIIEKSLIKNFKLDSDLIKVLVLSRRQLQSIIDHKPKGFGDSPEKYYSDAIFLIDISIEEALKVFQPREGVDSIWPGPGVIYSQRLGAQRTRSRLGQIIGSKQYKSMTIRSWNTTIKLLQMLTGVKA